jgi:hypothetical protein
MSNAMLWWRLFPDVDHLGGHLGEVFIADPSHGSIFSLTRGGIALVGVRGDLRAQEPPLLPLSARP